MNTANVPLPSQMPPNFGRSTVHTNRQIALFDDRCRAAAVAIFLEEWTKMFTLFFVSFLT